MSLSLTCVFNHRVSSPCGILILVHVRVALPPRICHSLAFVAVALDLVALGTTQARLIQALFDRIGLADARVA